MHIKATHVWNEKTDSMLNLGLEEQEKNNCIITESFAVIGRKQ